MVELLFRVLDYVVDGANSYGIVGMSTLLITPFIMGGLTVYLVMKYKIVRR